MRLPWNGSRGYLTEAVQPAMIGIDVLLPETGEAHGQQEAPTAEHAPHKEDADVSARTALGGGGRAGCPTAGAFGSGAALLQCRALRRAAAAAPDARRPGVGGSPRHSSCTETGTTGGFLCLARAVLDLSSRPACVCGKNRPIFS